MSARVTGTDPADITYTRDALDRIVRRDASTGDTTATVIDAYTGSGDSADVALTSDLRLATRSLSLPGGALYTVRAGTPASWDHPTVRGDLCLTTDPAGHQSGGLRSYTPFGEPLTPAGTVDPDAVPDNQPGSMDHGWLGQHQRPTEHAGALSLVQMGARPYSPLLARFLSVDPIEGGSANDYDYVAADPINTTDLDGHSPWSWAKRQVSRAWHGAGRAVRWGLNNRVVRIAVASFAAGLFCGFTLGSGCVLIAGIAIGAGLGVANHAIRGGRGGAFGYVRAAVNGGIDGGYGAMFGMARAGFARGAGAPLRRSLTMGWPGFAWKTRTVWTKDTWVGAGRLIRTLWNKMER